MSVPSLSMCMCEQCVGLLSGLLTSDETEMGGFQVESQAAPLLAKKDRDILLRLEPGAKGSGRYPFLGAVYISTVISNQDNTSP